MFTEKNRINYCNLKYKSVLLLGFDVHNFEPNSRVRQFEGFFVFESVVRTPTSLRPFSIQRNRTPSIRSPEAIRETRKRIYFCRASQRNFAEQRHFVPKI
jgi:hypothetical protein